MLSRIYRRSLVDLAALRFSPLTAGGRSLPSAGLPWFMTMFGWPFDNSLIAWGLRRYGFKAEAAQIAAGILDGQMR